MATAKEFAQSIKAKYPQYANVDDMDLAKRMVDKYPQYADRVQFDEPGMMSKAWDALAVPEQKSREGLKMMANATKVEPTGNMVRDVAFNTPSIALDTLADVAPGFISRGSMLTAGALKGAQLAAPAINAVGGAIGRTAESTSGLGYRTPGVLAETVNEPSILWGKGKDAARQAYKAVQDVNQIRPELQGTANNKVFVMKVLKGINDGSATSDEALEGRKALDALGDNVPDVFRKQTRAVFDALAKEKFADADKAYARAIKSEALRNFWGLNKGGTPSIVKGGLVMGVGQGALSPILSPAVQGGMAAGIGGARKLALPFIESPERGALVDPVMRRFQGRE